MIDLDGIDASKYLRLAFSREGKNAGSSSPLHNLRNIKLHCIQKWPHNLIVDERMMEHYSSVSSFLLSLHFARWKLDTIWIQRHMVQSLVMHEIQIIRSEMVQFLRGFSDFVFQSIIAAQWFSFISRISEFQRKNILNVDRPVFKFG